MLSVLLHCMKRNMTSFSKWIVRNVQERKNLKTFGHEILKDPPKAGDNLLIRHKSALATSDKTWLLIFDGYNHIRNSPGWFLLDQYFPPSLNGRLGHIVNSKDERVGTG